MLLFRTYSDAKYTCGYGKSLYESAAYTSAGTGVKTQSVLNFQMIFVMLPVGNVVLLHVNTILSLPETLAAQTRCLAVLRGLDMEESHSQ